jgi:DNA-binding CsgD family transcriptional regulator
LDDAWKSVSAFCLLGDIASAHNDLETARAQYGAALSLCRQTNNDDAEPRALIGLGTTVVRDGDLVTGRKLLVEGLTRSTTLGLTPRQAAALDGLAIWATAAGEAALALNLAGVTAAYCERTGRENSPTDKRLLGTALEPAYRVLGDAASIEFERGRQMSWASAIVLATAEKSPTPSLPDSESRDRTDREHCRDTMSPSSSQLSAEMTNAPVRIRLTRRQAEVLRLVAAGKTDRQIAAELVLSEKTIGRHLEDIYARLGVSSRAAATLVAVRHDLI